MDTKNEIPWWRPVAGKEEQRLVQEVLSSGNLGDGNLCRDFEHKVAELLEAKYVLATPNGTMAITLALQAVGVGAGDEVIIPDLTWIATAHAVAQTGAKVILADIKEDLTIDPNSVRSKITSKTKAIVPVHVSGRAADMDALLSISKEKNVPIIEDAAEAFMSKHKGKNLGTIGSVGAFSMSIYKVITSGQGGFVVTNDDKIASKMLEIKNQGIAKDESFWSKVGGKLGLLATGNDIVSSVGYNYKWSNLNAAVALGQLSDLDNRITRIKKTHAIYQNKLPKQVRLLPFDITRGELPLWIDCMADNRDKLFAYLEERKIHARKFWLPVHSQKPYAYNGKDNDYPVSSRVHKDALWLPSAFTMTDTDVEYVCQTISAFYS